MGNLANGHIATLIFSTIKKKEKNKQSTCIQSILLHASCRKAGYSNQKETKEKND